MYLRIIFFNVKIRVINTSEYVVPSDHPHTGGLWLIWVLNILGYLNSSQKIYPNARMPRIFIRVGLKFFFAP